MELSAAEVKSVVFSEARKGYSRGEVDAFLDRVARSLGQFEDRVRQLDQQIRHYASLEQTSQDRAGAAEELIMMAQNRAKEIVTRAEGEGQSHVDEATNKAAEIEDEIQQRYRDFDREISTARDTAEAYIKALKSFEKEYRDRMRAALEAQLRLLDEMKVAPPQKKPEQPALPEAPERKYERSGASQLVPLEQVSASRQAETSGPTPLPAAGSVPAGVPPAAPPPATLAEASLRAPANAEIELLFAAFVDAYDRGRADAFALLFDADARANQHQGRAAIRGEYDDLFRRSQWRRMQVIRMNWRRVGDTAQAKGEIAVRTGLRDGREHEERLSVDMELVRRDGRLVITRLDQRPGAP
ncbi:MAG: DivIVA domain-containing protein [Actinobacteria bacterium ATB1]|nr:DivIVA domain-containing protein [Actinobacteria bacterium ATB1]